MSRDHFIKKYEDLLAKRLLNKSSVSYEAEEMMIKKFKVECGFNIVSKMTQMFKDLEQSKELQANFQEYSPVLEVYGVDFQP